MSTIRDVAKAAQVSPATVSRILSADSSFQTSVETKARVLQAVQDLHYNYPSKKKQLHIGCVMSLTYSYSDPYFNDILSGIQSYCSKHNAFISLVVNHLQFQEMSPNLIHQIEELDGLIITDLPEEKLDFIKELKKKIVFVDNYVQGFCNIGYNQLYANKTVMDHIINCGYRKIAYIGGPSDCHDFYSSPRMIIIRDTFRKHNIPFTKDVIHNCDWDPQLCSLQLRELLNKHPDTEVIFAGSDSLAMVILSQLNELGIKCPEDIGVIGFNDIDLAKNFTPPLTTLKLPSVEMGETAARVLIEQIEKDVVYNYQLLLPVELIERKSTLKKQ